MNQSLYAHRKNTRKMKKKKDTIGKSFAVRVPLQQIINAEFILHSM
jgi:hypothetical protein